ncbi:MAG TPA: VWA domain-containing protein [Myxococcota bacterium]|jgi:hypothetical protein|nr:VWA domain-containing protein [Myxococcota bacterium]
MARRAAWWLALGAALGLLSAGCLCGPPGRLPAPDGGGGPGAGDADGDGLTDAQENAAQEVDIDGDGTPDYLDLDSDGDGLADADEAGDADLDTPPRDSDGDGAPDFRDTDSDANGIGDAMEGTGDADGDGLWDAFDADDDGDGLFDTAEIGPDPTAPVDFDGDGTPDYRDGDSDGDTISDAVESGTDTDLDGAPDRHDADSDGDGVPDVVEAGDADVATPPVDTDLDGTANFRDLDSDNDGLPDGQEDLNGNGAVDAGESDPLSPDTDGDGIPDLVEVAAGTDPGDPGSTIDPDDFFFVLPYMGPGDGGPLVFATDIVQADVHFSVDTTGSMGGLINNLQASLSTTIASLTAAVPSTAVGVSGFEDYPVGGSFFGSGFGDPACGDVPFYLTQRVTTDVVAAQAGVDVLDMPLGCGSDTPEAGFPTLWRAATGSALTWPGGSVPLYDPTIGYDPALGHGLIGGAGFRAGSLPIIVHATDAISHTPADYAGSGITAPSEADVVAAFAAIGAKFVGIDAGGVPRAELETIARDTGSTVPTTAFSGPCAGGTCCTGVGGAGVTADPGGLCPLVFSTDGSGSGLGTTIVDAIEALVLYGTLDINAIPLADPAELASSGIDTAAFITAITPVPPPPPGSTISGDTFLDVQPGNPVTFMVDAFNDLVPSIPTTQLFQCTIQVLGNGVTVLDSRTVYIIIPPEGGNPIIM